MRKFTRGFLTLTLAAGLLIGSPAAADEYTIESLPREGVELIEEAGVKENLYIIDRSELADGLTGGVLALKESGNLLVFDSTNPTEGELELIENATSFTILGGITRVSEDYESRENFSERISGEDRYETAVAAALASGEDRDLIIVSGENYIDALVSLPMADRENRNVILVRGDSLPESTKAYLVEHGMDKDLVFIGGENSLSPEVKAEVLQVLGRSDDAAELTIAGENRYETSMKIANRSGSSSLVLTSWDDYDSAIMASNITDNLDGSIVATSSIVKEDLDAFFGEKEARLYSIGIDQIRLSSESERDLETEEVLEETEEVTEAPELNEEPAVEEEAVEEPAGEEAPAVKPEQAFIDAALAMKGYAYSQSARMAPGQADCSSLVLRALINSGLTTDTRNLTTYTIFNDPRFYSVPRSEARPGDVLYQDGHIAVYLGGDTVIEAKTWGVPAGYGNYLSRFTHAFRITGL